MLTLRVRGPAAARELLPGSSHHDKDTERVRQRSAPAHRLCYNGPELCSSDQIALCPPIDLPHIYSTQTASECFDAQSLHPASNVHTQSLLSLGQFATQAGHKMPFVCQMQSRVSHPHGPTNTHPFDRTSRTPSPSHSAPLKEHPSPCKL